MNLRYSFFIILSIFLLFSVSQADSMAPDPFSDPLADSLSRLIHMTTETGQVRDTDMAPINKIVDFIVKKDDLADYTPRDYECTRGSFISFSIKRSITDLVRYAYNPMIPEGAITPYSVNYASWQDGTDGAEPLPDLWKLMTDFSKPFSFNGTCRLAIAPDQNTGGYYEYDLYRRFIGLRRGGQRIFFSLSQQMGDSDVGKIGYVVGDKEDWNYIYTQKKGLNRRGLGWVKSKIYHYYTVCCLVESKPGEVKIGMFQWVGAGWLGMNVVDTHHIRKGLERHALQFKAMLESEKMPSPQTLEEVSRSLDGTSDIVLREKAMVVISHLKELANHDSSLKNVDAIKNLDEHAYVERMNKSQLMNTLMREFVKHNLGKPTPLHSTFWVALKENRVEKQKSRT